MNGTIYFCSQEHGHFVLQTMPSGNEKGEGRKTVTKLEKTIPSSTQNTGPDKGTICYV